MVAVTGITVWTCERGLWPLGWRLRQQGGLTLPGSHQAILQDTLSKDLKKLNLNLKFV